MPRKTIEDGTARTKKIIAALGWSNPGAHCELNHINPLECSSPPPETCFEPQLPTLKNTDFSRMHLEGERTRSRLPQEGVRVGRYLAATWGLLRPRRGLPVGTRGGAYAPHYKLNCYNSSPTDCQSNARRDVHS